ncbi:MAG TPA: extracellular solute-binding protein [Alphaproteobacteria bacterium]
MKKKSLSRRGLLRLSAGLGGYALMPRVVSAAEVSTVTPQLIDAARKEGKLAFYTAVDLQVAEKIAKSFEARYPGISVRVERSGSERVFQRIGQEYTTRIYAADVINTTDAAHFVIWKRDGWLTPYVPEDVAQNYASEHRDPDGMYASWRISLSPIAYNTNLVKPADAPKSFGDLLDPKWTGKIVKAHPSYSGTVVTATFQIVRNLGWDYLEKLGKQKVLQVQSSTEPPKKLALGERAVMADGNEYNVLLLKEAGQPLEVVYPTEGTPLIVGPSAVLKNAPNPNAARLFQSYLYSAEAQQFMIDVGDLRSFHKQTREKPGHKPMSEIKLMKDDPEGVVSEVEEIKKRYAAYFGT